MSMPFSLWNMVDAARLDMSKLIAVRYGRLGHLRRFQIR
jgi:hypothetical protein